MKYLVIITLMFISIGSAEAKSTRGLECKDLQKASKLDCRQCLKKGGHYHKEAREGLRCHLGN